MILFDMFLPAGQVRDYQNSEGADFSFPPELVDTIIVGGGWDSGVFDLDGNNQFWEISTIYSGGDITTPPVWRHTLTLDCTGVTAGQQATVDLVYENLLHVAAGESINVPNVGMIQISQNQAQPAYSEPGGGVARDGAGNEIWLPHDADNNFSDTYVVTAVELVEGEVWVQFFLGSADFVWVRLSGVTPLSYLPAE